MSSQILSRDIFDWLLNSKTAAEREEMPAAALLSLATTPPGACAPDDGEWTESCRRAKVPRIVARASLEARAGSPAQETGSLTAPEYTQNRSIDSQSEGCGTSTEGATKSTIKPALPAPPAPLPYIRRHAYLSDAFCSSGAESCRSQLRMMPTEGAASLLLSLFRSDRRAPRSSSEGTSLGASAFRDCTRSSEGGAREVLAAHELASLASTRGQARRPT